MDGFLVTRRIEGYVDELGSEVEIARLNGEAGSKNPVVYGPVPLR